MKDVFMYCGAILGAVVFVVVTHDTSLLYFFAFESIDV